MTENQSNKKEAPVLRADLVHEAFENIISGRAEGFALPRNKKADKLGARFCMENAVMSFRKGRLPDPHFRAEFTDIATGEVVCCTLGHTEYVTDPENGEEAVLFPFVAVNDVPISRRIVTVTVAPGRKGRL